MVADPRYAERVKRQQDPASWLRDASGALTPNSGPLISIATPYVNAGGTRTSGIDVEAVLRTSMGPYGRLATRVTTAYTIDFRKAQNAGEPMFDLAGTNGAVAYDLTSVGELPRWKSTLSSTWRMARHSTTASAHFVSGVSLLARYSVQDDGSIGPYAEPFCPYGARTRPMRGRRSMPARQVVAVTAWPALTPICTMRAGVSLRCGWMRGFREAADRGRGGYSHLALRKRRYIYPVTTTMVARANG